MEVFVFILLLINVIKQIETLNLGYLNKTNLQQEIGSKDVVNCKKENWNYSCDLECLNSKFI